MFVCFFHICNGVSLALSIFRFIQTGCRHVLQSLSNLAIAHEVYVKLWVTKESNVLAT